MRFLFLLCFTLAAHYLCAQDATGIIVRWKMEAICELTDDFTESPSNGVLNEVSLTTDKDNLPNAAFLFQSNDSYITLGAVDKLKLADDKSISFRIKPVVTGANRKGSIFSYGTGINIGYEEQSSVTRLNITFGNTSYMLVNLVPNQWQSVVVTFKKAFSASTSKAHCYIDGALTMEAEKNTSTHNFTNSIALIGAADQSTLTNGFHGSLDELSIYNRVLSSEEILDQVLPVKLEFFKGKKLHDFIELKWKTQIEENVSHFDLQKSLDGRLFRNISKIDAGKKNYLTYDFTGIVDADAWYRLQIVDKDGKTAYSNIIKVAGSNALDADEQVVKIFPNPGSDVINLAGIFHNTDVSIYNNAGTMISRQRVSGNKTVDISRLPAGLYYLVFTDNHKRIVSKFIKR